MTVKKILKIISLALFITTLILAIINLVNYYGYVNCLEQLSNTDITMLDKFNIQESRETYQYRALTMLPWTCFISIISVIFSTTTYFITKETKEPSKIR